MNKIGTNETEFVKDKRKTHCKGCMNENGFCGAQDVLMCWLRKTYLPEGEWHRAMMSDVEAKNVNEIVNEVDKEILKEILKNDRKHPTHARRLP